MMTAAEDWVRARGGRAHQLHLHSSNLAALAFYEQLGLNRDPILTLSKRLAPRR